MIRAQNQNPSVAPAQRVGRGPTPVPTEPPSDGDWWPGRDAGHEDPGAEHGAVVLDRGQGTTETMGRGGREATFLNITQRPVESSSASFRQGNWLFVVSVREAWRKKRRSKIGESWE